MEQNYPILLACKPLKSEFKYLREIKITSNNFTLGRALNNSAVIPFIAISRNHCVIREVNENDWIIEDYSTYGIEINGHKLGKGLKRKLLHNDVVKLEQTEEFIYKFLNPLDSLMESPRKRIKLEEDQNDDVLNSVKIKFEESQSHELKSLEDKITNAKQMQETSTKLKEKLQLDMNRKIQQLEDEFAVQIENLKGEKDEVERQKMLLIEEKNAQLISVKEEMEEKMSELMEQIKRHNETESELLKENTLLKEKLLKEREEFLLELSRENSSKQDLLEKLNAKLKEQEEFRLKEKQELEEMLRQETEQLKLAKEKEFKELENQKKLRELELEQEVNNIKKTLEEQIEQTKQQKIKAEWMLSEQAEQMKKLSCEEKAKMDQLIQEREEIEKKLNEAQINAEKSLEELRKRVMDRETELAALAAERIQKQSEQSGEVINSLQEQLEKVRNQLQAVESEKNTLLENLCVSSDKIDNQSSNSQTKESTLAEVGELMENELQCSICAELFISATTLNCSHTFCKYCITRWKKKKKDCPICRSPITSECKSLVLDTFIEKMVATLTDEMKLKRSQLLKSREELELELSRQLYAGSHRRRSNHESDYNSESNYESEEGEEEEEHDDFYDDHYQYNDIDEFDDIDDYGDEYVYSDSDGGLDDTAAAGAGAAWPVGAAAAGNGLPASAGGRTDDNGVGTRRRGLVPGRPGSFYGGYGRCFNCGARGHWAPGCPFR